MGTSKSTEEARQYSAGVSAFSGRPDPIWSLSEEVAGKLKKLYEEAEKYEGPTVAAPPLGYRGAFLKDDGGHEWFAYRGVVTFTGPHGSEARRDVGREFERALVDSTPEGLIPPALVAHEFN